MTQSIAVPRLSNARHPPCSSLTPLVMRSQDRFAGLLCEALAPSAPPLAVANMRLLCDFAHMVYDVAAQSSLTEADVRLH